MTEFDAIVVGGGPAGSVCASRLAALGRRVVLLERDRHPRFHLGESLLPSSLNVLEAIGVLESVRERFLAKHGARFVDGVTETRTVRYAFADAFHARWGFAFQVPRDEFDELLFRRAGACGAELRENFVVERILREHGRAVGIEGRYDGKPCALTARFVVDATGRDALMARDGGLLERIPGLERTALYSQVRGGWRDAGERAGDIQIGVFGEGQERGWFWLIPFADGRTSVGAVVSPTWIRAHRSAGGAEALFDAALAQAPVVGQMIAGAERLFSPQATGDYSFRVRTRHGPGWVALGDATGFIDPLFSTGAHLAMHGALQAADAIHASLSNEAATASAFASWEEGQRVGMDLFLGAVQAFYGGDLVSYLFADPQHPFLRRAITSMLSGDVFDPGAPWAREMRSRFPPLV